MSISIARPRAAFILLLAAFLIGTSVVTVAAGAATKKSEEHCVVFVVDEKPSGEFVTTDLECFGTFSEAMVTASGGTVDLSSGAPASSAFTDPGFGTLASTFTLGIHYDGLNGTGSSVTVVGSSCTGGYWNTSPSWDNRISSTYNGCHRVKHHDRPNRAGITVSTTGSGTTDNVPWPMNNRAESLSYWSS